MARRRPIHRTKAQSRYPLVRVEWTDAESDDSWESVKNLQESLTRHVVSVGFLIHEEDRFLILARSYGGNDDDTEGRLTIPKPWITSIRRIS